MIAFELMATFLTSLDQNVENLLNYLSYLKRAMGSSVEDESVGRVIRMKGKVKNIDPTVSRDD